MPLGQRIMAALWYFFLDNALLFFFLGGAVCLAFAYYDKFLKQNRDTDNVDLLKAYVKLMMIRRYRFK